MILKSWVYNLSYLWYAWLEPILKLQTWKTRNFCLIDSEILKMVGLVGFEAFGTLWSVRQRLLAYLRKERMQLCTLIENLFGWNCDSKHLDKSWENLCYIHSAQLNVSYIVTLQGYDTAIFPNAILVLWKRNDKGNDKRKMMSSADT